MNKDYTHMVVLLDASGSMSFCWNDTIGGLEKLFQEQKLLPGKMTFSLVTFSNLMTRLHNFVDINSVVSLAKAAIPNGGTALYDAFCRTVDEEGRGLAQMQEKDRPSKVLFVVVTDGGENASLKFDVSQVRARLQTQRDKYSWDFLFLGADFDVTDTAVSFGASPAMAMNYSKTSTENTSRQVSNFVGNYRSKSKLDMADVDSLKSNLS